MATLDLASLQPSPVFAAFAELCAIPHGSGHEQALSDYLVEYARRRGFDAEQDTERNVLIRAPGSPGCTAEPVIMQAHVDMVLAKADGLVVDMATQPVAVWRDGDWLRAEGTTLGADNGIGVAYALALLDADLPHPPLELVFTTREEIGMNGALAFDASSLRGKYLINLDSEDEGIFYASCSGGTTVEVALPVETQPAETAGMVWRAVTLAGLKGGHSGTMIHEQRGNALRLLGRVLDDLRQRFDLRLGAIEGGIVSNSIPASAIARLQLRPGDEPAIRARLQEWQAVFATELRGSDEQPAVELIGTEDTATHFSPTTVSALLHALTLLPHGVEAMDLVMGDPTLVETSANFARVRLVDNTILLTVSIRSSLASKTAMLARRVNLMAEEWGAGFELRSSYPGWTYNPESHLRDVFKRAYATLNSGKEPVVKGIHAGLECGVFYDNFRRAGREIDIISFGPDIRGAHSPDERVSISSTARIWELLKEGLRILAEGR